MKEGFDVALEMSGSPESVDRSAADDVSRRKNRAARDHARQARRSTGTSSSSARLTIKGIYGREMYETWYKMTAMIQSGLDISPVITHRFPYTQFKEAIELMKSGNSGKIVLDWSER